MTRAIETHVAIEAPPEAVWAVLADAGAFAAWCEDVQFPGDAPVEGARVPMRVRLFGVPLSVKVVFERIDEPRELRWRGGPRGLFEGTHYFRLSPGPGGGTDLLHGERFDGLARPILLPLLRAELEAFYGRINRALKRRVEAAGSS